MNGRPQERLRAIARKRPESWWAAAQRIADRPASQRSAFDEQTLASALSALNTPIERS